MPADPNFLLEFFENLAYAGETESTTEDEDEDEEEEDEETENDNDDDDGFIPLDAPRVSQTDANSSEIDIVVVEDDDDDERDAKRYVGSGGEVCSSNTGEGCSQEKEWCRGDVDGLFCSICMEAWTNGGEHHICCLPCGHIYGMSCIKKWLQQRRNSRKCPQCNSKCTLKDVRKLYASQLVVVDEESQKRIRFLEGKCAQLKKKDNEWCKKETEWKKREGDLNLNVKRLTERAEYLERSLVEAQSRASNIVAASRNCPGESVSGDNLGAEWHGRESCCSFVLQKELRVHGGRIFDVNVANHIILVARRLPQMGGNFVLTKLSLMSACEMEDIPLPSSTKAVRDLHVSPWDDGLVLFGSMGKKLSVLSAESNNVVLTYDLPAAAWSCSWDRRSSYLLYAGLQNGFLMVFDMRHTQRPLESLEGTLPKPIHTIEPLSSTSAVSSSDKGVLTASAVGLCQWFEGRPSMVAQPANQEVCISLAYCPSSDEVIASYRPKVEVSSDMAFTQAFNTPSCHGPGVQGSHILFQRVGSSCYQKLGSAYGNVANIGFPKSAILDVENQNRLFAFGDEITSELILQDLPSFAVVQRLRIQRCPIRDVKFNGALSNGLLGCLSEDTLQLYSRTIS